MKKIVLSFMLAAFTLVSLNAQTIADIVANSEDHNTLEAALDAAELTAVLDGTDEYTLFAPTDDAFSVLPASYIEALLSDPEGILTDILLYHVVSGAALSTDLSDGQDVPTLFDNQTVSVSIDGSTVMINMSTVTGADIVADNGVVHVIDAVLIPETTTIYDVVMDSPDHTTLEAAIMATGLDETLSSPGTYTLFAPTDDAFAALPDGLVESLLLDPEGVLLDILTYHAVGDVALSSSLSDGQEIETLIAQNVDVSIDGEIVMINNAMVTVADIVTLNGVIHVIDAVLVPETTTIYDVVEASPDHTTLETVLGLSGLDETLDGAGAYTLFAPTDAAFEMVDEATLNALLDDPNGLLTDVLLYHVVGSINISSNLMAGPVNTVFGEPVEISFDSPDVFVNTALVVTADIPTINGVVHVIDQVLVPTTLSVDDVEALSSFSAYPNPTNNELTVELGLESSESITVDFVNVLGQRVKSLYLGNRGAGMNREIIPMNDLTNGIYFMNIRIGDEVFTEKIQVNK